MATGPHTERRQVQARIFTPSGWLVGTFHPDEGQSFLDFLNGTKEFYTLTEVQLPRQSSPLPFLALQRSATILVLPATPDELGTVDDAAQAHQVSCLLEGGVLMGALPLGEDVRVSDHLMSTANFFALRSCTLGLDSASGEATMEAAPGALVNASRVVGVAEMVAAVEAG